MRTSFPIAVFAVLIAVLASYATSHIINKNSSKLVFADLETDYSLTDLNNCGCEKIDLPVLQHILKNGTLIAGKEVSDQYSTTGCTIKGSVMINGKTNQFTYDYGGLIYFSDGRILGCGESCCKESYPYCSWNKEDLKGFWCPMAE